MKVNYFRLLFHEQCLDLTLSKEIFHVPVVDILPPSPLPPPLRHPVASHRPSFSEVCDHLSVSDEVLLSWTSSDQVSAAGATPIGPDMGSLGVHCIGCLCTPLPPVKYIAIGP